MLIFGIFRNIKKLVVLIIIAALFFFGYDYLNKKLNLNFGSDEKLIVSKVIDGDTFRLSNNEKVRLIGIDTPEKYAGQKLDKDAARSEKDKKSIQILGEKASEYVRHLVEGKVVTLKRDTRSADRDRYNRLLRYIYLEDGTCLNAKLIQDGFALAYTKFPFDKEEEFIKLEKESRKNNKGLWGLGLK